MRKIASMAAMAGVLCASAGARAQDGSDAGVPPKQWDWQVAVAFRASDRQDAAITRDNHIPADDQTETLALGLDVGRYWGHHLKTEVGILQHETYSTSFYDPYTAPNGARGTTYGEASTRMTEVLLAVTAQFGKNWFTHPYVSTGLRAGLARTVEQGTSIAGANFTPPLYREEVDRRYSARLLRPYVAAGAKFYFNQRTFVRSDVALGFRDYGLSQWMLRTGFGKDF